MSSVFRKYGFAVVVAGAIALGGVAALHKALFGGAGAHDGGAAQAVASKSGGAAPKAGETPLVEVAIVAPRTFADDIQALGTAQARESIVVAAKVTDVIRAIRFESGDRVGKGQVLVELSSVEQQADLSEARAALASQEREYARFKELSEKGFTPKARLEQAQAAYEQAAARVAALQSRIADRTIRAPFAGVMGLRTASPGALVQPGQAIGTLDDTSTIKLDFDVPEVYLTRIKPGVPLVAATAALAGKAFNGKIDNVDSRVDPTSRTIKVRAFIPNTAGVLKPGMLMTVSVQSNARTALGVPEMAIIEKADGASVLRVVDKDGAPSVASAKVKLGQRVNGYVEVTGGLADGDRIVVEGVQRAKPGQPIRIDPAKPAQPIVAPNDAGPKPLTGGSSAARL